MLEIQVLSSCEEFLLGLQKQYLFQNQRMPCMACEVNVPALLDVWREDGLLTRSEYELLVKERINDPHKFNELFAYWTKDDERNERGLGRRGIPTEKEQPVLNGLRAYVKRELYKTGQTTSLFDKIELLLRDWRLDWSCNRFLCFGRCGHRSVLAQRRKERRE
eukprot:TRINITY_DN67855_c6_g4_i7.p1 TRINITY_DN67855_c6_g4~~TRINITY_DN67855_c6_g4_i7.p1  ORF type:complete len:163 (-),score=0.56 TRINITY_DN67855_c6_g4_i7:147-635(-)